MDKEFKILKEWKPYDNYKKFCIDMGLPVLNGTSKTAQLKTLEQYYDIEKVPNSNKLTVKSKETIVPKTDRRKQRVGKYSVDIDTIVLYKINKGFRKPYMQLICKDIYSNLLYPYFNDKSISTLYGIDKKSSIYIKNSIDDLLTRTFYNSLTRLKRKGIITIEKYWNVVKGSEIKNVDCIIEAIRKDILLQNGIRNEYMLYHGCSESKREMVLEQFEEELSLNGIEVYGRETHLSIIDKDVKIPSGNEYGTACKRLYKTFQDVLIAKAIFKKKSEDKYVEIDLKLLEYIFGEIDLTRTEGDVGIENSYTIDYEKCIKFYEEYIIHENERMQSRPM